MPTKPSPGDPKEFFINPSAWRHLNPIQPEFGSLSAGHLILTNNRKSQPFHMAINAKF
jgi:hypothetical protein